MLRFALSLSLTGCMLLASAPAALAEVHVKLTVR